MNFKPGDQVRIIEDRKHKIVPSALADVKALNTNGVFTIHAIIDAGGIGKDLKYVAKELDFEWNWNDIDLELIKLSEHNFDSSEKINSRFEILDL